MHYLFININISISYIILLELERISQRKNFLKMNLSIILNCLTVPRKTVSADLQKALIYP